MEELKEKFAYDKVPPRVSNHKSNVDGKKTLSSTTILRYKKKLDILAEYGFSDEASLLKNPLAVLAVMRTYVKTFGDMSAFLSAVFWVIGRQDFEKDSRGKPYYDEFQKVKKHSGLELYSKE